MSSPPLIQLIQFGALPNSQIRPCLRRCLICTLRPPCKHTTVQQAKALLVQELSSYPENPNQTVCPSYARTGQCHSMTKRFHCIYAHPPITDPTVVLGTDYTNNVQHIPDRVKPVQDATNDCILCKLRMQCSTHFKLSKQDRKTRRRQQQMQTDDSLSTTHTLSTSPRPHQRCPLCTLPLPCSHFANLKELNAKRKEELAYTKRYPIKSTFGQPNCIHWVQSGTCVMHDTLGICMFWHPQIYANKRIHLDDPIQINAHSTSLADIASYRSHTLGFHGMNGLPGEHRSSGGCMKIGKSKLLNQMHKQDCINVEAARARCFYPLNLKTGKPNVKQWSFPSPPLFKLGVQKKAKTVPFGLKKLLRKGKRSRKTKGNINGGETEEEKDARRVKGKREAKRLSLLRFALLKIYWHGTTCMPVDTMFKD